MGINDQGYITTTTSPYIKVSLTSEDEGTLLFLALCRLCSLFPDAVYVRQT